jgi:hypothetical protein
LLVLSNKISRAAGAKIKELKRELKELQKKTGVYGRVTIRFPKKKSVAKPQQRALPLTASDMRVLAIGREGSRERPYKGSSP